MTPAKTLICHLNYDITMCCACDTKSFLMNEHNDAQISVG